MKDGRERSVDVVKARREAAGWKITLLLRSFTNNVRSEVGSLQLLGEANMCSMEGKSEKEFSILKKEEGVKRKV